MKFLTIVPNDDAPWTVKFESHPGGEPTLPFLQKIVGGCVDCVATPDGYDVWVNDEGLIYGMPYNPVTKVLWGFDLVGPAVIARSTPMGETVGLTVSQMLDLKERLIAGQEAGA